MKILGVCLIFASLAIGFISDYYIDFYAIEPFIMLAFGYFLLGIWVLIISKNDVSTDVLKMTNPPEPPKKKILDKFILSGKANYDFRFWHYDKKKYSLEWNFFNEISATCHNALIIDWFRDIHGLHTYIEMYDDDTFDYVITGAIIIEVNDYNDGPFKTFLDAQNRTIEMMVEIIYGKEKKLELPKDGESDLSSFVERPLLPKDRNKAHSILEILRDNN